MTTRQRQQRGVSQTASRRRYRRAHYSFCPLAPQGRAVRHESRTAVIKRRLNVARIVLVHGRYLRRKFLPPARAVNAARPGSIARGLGEYLRWLHQRARRRQWSRARLRRRYAATHIEMHRRSARLKRIYGRRARTGAPMRLRWVVIANRGRRGMDEVFPPPRPPKVVFSHRARIRAWLADMKRKERA
jgi:hypothetical protein